MLIWHLFLFLLVEIAAQLTSSILLVCSTDFALLKRSFGFIGCIVVWMRTARVTHAVIMLVVQTIRNLVIDSSVFSLFRWLLLVHMIVVGKSDIALFLVFNRRAASDQLVLSFDRGSLLYMSFVSSVSSRLVDPWFWDWLFLELELVGWWWNLQPFLRLLNLVKCRLLTRRFGNLLYKLSVDIVTHRKFWRSLLGLL